MMYLNDHMVFDREPKGLNSLCPFDLSKLQTYHLRREKLKCGETIFLTFKCIKCKHVFTNLPIYEDLELIEIGEGNKKEEFINIKMDENALTRHTESYAGLIRVKALKLQVEELKEKMEYAKEKADKDRSTDNLIDLFLAEKDFEKKEAELRAVLEARAAETEMYALRDKKLREELKAREEQAAKEYKALVAEANLNQKHEENYIALYDFVIRRNVFKCIHKGHQLKDMFGTVDIINVKGQKKSVQVSVGYCPDCNIYYVHDSSLKLLCNKGTPLCRIKDEKKYSVSFTPGMNLKMSDESVLMRYGYNVNTTVNLSSSRRQNILAVLIDYDLISKSQIISLLDFFISQRRNMTNMENAVKKWTEDREFVEYYDPGTYRRVVINSINRD